MSRGRSADHQRIGCRRRSPGSNSARPSTTNPSAPERSQRSRLASPWRPPTVRSLLLGRADPSPKNGTGSSPTAASFPCASRSGARNRRASFGTRSSPGHPSAPRQSRAQQRAWVSREDTPWRSINSRRADHFSLKLAARSPVVSNWHRAFSPCRPTIGRRRPW